MATWTSRAGVSMHARVGGFWEFLPTGYNGTTQFPALIVFHGRGEQGNGGTQLNSILSQGIPKLINQRMGTSSEFPYPMVVICVQYYTEDTGNYPSGFVVQSVINYVKANYAVNLNKVYLTGLSWGGAAVTDWGDVGTITDIAAIMSLCPASSFNPGISNKYKAVGMPFWFFHGDADSVVTVENSRGWFAGLNGAPAISPLAKYTEMAGYNHTIWNDVYDWTWFTVDGVSPYDWLLAQTRGSGTPTLSMPIISNTNALYPMTLVGGQLALLMPLLTNGNTMYPPVVSGGANTWQIVGTPLSLPGTVRPSVVALTATRVVVHNDGTDTIAVYDFSGTSWTLFASISVPGSFAGGLAKLSSSTFAYVDGGLQRLRKYSIGAGTITLVGNQFVTTGLNAPTICGLGENRIALTDQSVKSLVVYDFNGTDWVQFGTPYANAGGFVAEMQTISSTRVLIWHGDDGNLSIYDLTGSTWSLVSQTPISYSTSAIAVLSSVRIAYINDGVDTLRVLEYVGSAYVDQGISLAILNVFYPALTSMTSTRVAMIDQNNDELRVYDFGAPASPSQTIAMPVISSTSVLYPMTVVPRSVTVQMPVLANSSTLFPMTLFRASSLNMPLLNNSNTLYPMTVVPRSVAVQLPVLNNSASVLYPMTVVPRSVTIRPPLLVNDNQFYGMLLSLQGGPQTLLMPAIINENTLYPMRAVYSQPVGLPIINAVGELYPMTIIRGGPIVTPSQKNFKIQIIS